MADERLRVLNNLTPQPIRCREHKLQWSTVMYCNYVTLNTPYFTKCLVPRVLHYRISLIIYTAHTHTCARSCVYTRTHRHTTQIHITHTYTNNTNSGYLGDWGGSPASSQLIGVQSYGRHFSKTYFITS